MSTPNPPNGHANGAAADQIGFFRVAGLIRSLLAIIVPALVLQGIFLNLMIKDRVRDGIDAVQANVVTQKEWIARQAVGERTHAEMKSETIELRERVAALEARVRAMELDGAASKAAAAAAATKR